MREVGVDTDTAQTSDPSQQRSGHEWALTLAMDCGDLLSSPSRVSLADVTEVVIGRGDERRFDRSRSRLQIDLSDHLVSRIHTRLAFAVNEWRIEDAGSKNGTRVNGERVERATLADGDVIECGGTFFVIRRDAPRDPTGPTGPTESLGTLCPAYERELALLPKIARSRASVLVFGDSGTGKEVVARAIHELSRRAGPFVAVNCGAIPESLIASELFGSRRGAFSGAEDRTGLIRSAERGTLFLDEIAELPTSSQAALLRVLQEGELIPLGADKAVSVDVRVVAATNRALEAHLDDGRFRRDLYARLRGYEARLPPLRARIEDLGLLCAALMARIAPQARKSFSRAAARALFLHTWPFNIRELEQVLRTALAVCEGSEIDIGDLRLRSTAASEQRSERERLVGLLQKYNGNLSAVARDLDTSRSQVRRLLAKHGVDADEFRPRE